MRTVFNIILLVCMYPVLPVIYFVLRNEAKPKKNIVLGVTLPYHARQDESVLALCKSFKKSLGIIALALAVLPAVTFFLKHSSVIMTYYMTWMVLAIVFPYIPYTVYHRRIKALKVTNGWYSDTAGKAIIDTKAAVMPKQMLSIWWFVPPVVLSLIPIVYTLCIAVGSEEFWPMMIGYGTFAVMVAVFYLFYRILYRQRAEVVDDNTALSMALTRVRRYNWSKCWIWTAWLTGIFNIFFWLFINNSIGLLIATAVYTIVLIVIIMRAELITRKVQQKLTEESGKSAYTDDDEYWIIGMFYHNPNDKHLMINNRVGIGTTLNLAKTSGKIIMVFSVLCILAMPFMGFWMMAEEFTPVKIEINEAQLVVSHTSVVYKIDLEDIKSAVILETLPSSSKITGSGFETLLKGKFRVKDIGVCELCLNPKSSPFIKITTDKRIYILGTNNRDETLTVYELLS